MDFVKKNYKKTQSKVNRIGKDFKPYVPDLPLSPERVVLRRRGLAALKAAAEVKVSMSLYEPSVSASCPAVFFSACPRTSRFHGWLRREKTDASSCRRISQLNYSSRHENCPSVSACPVCLNPAFYGALSHVLLPTLSPHPSPFPATLETHIFLHPT